MLVVKNPSANAAVVRDMGSIPGSGRSLEEAWLPTPVFLLENPLDGGTWRAMVRRVTKSRTQLKRLSTRTYN